jgi:hypothetical protein
MDTFKFVNLESGRLYNYIPENINVKTLTSSDGGYHDGDHLRFDGIHKVFRYRNEVSWLAYLNLYTRTYDCNYSEVNETYILKKDCQYDDKIGDYIFGGEYEHLNNKSKLEELRNPVVKTVEETIPSYYVDYSSRGTQRSLSETISNLSDLMADINMPDLGSIGSSLYSQWQQLSRNEQEEILEQVADRNNEDLQLELEIELEEEPTPF